MLTLQEIVSLPDAARALLVAHRWIGAQQYTGTDAFDLLHGVVRIGVADADAAGVVGCIAEGGDRAHAALALLHACLMLDRYTALAKSLGVEPELDQSLLQQIIGLIQRTRQGGGAV